MLVGGGTCFAQPDIGGSLPGDRRLASDRGTGVLEGEGAASDKHTVSGDAPALDTPLLRGLLNAEFGYGGRGFSGWWWVVWGYSPCVSSSRRVPVEQWKDPRQVLGVWGERMAAAYLLERGWVVEAHRFRFARHDIDIVARLGQLVAFIEVKTRRTTAFGDGREAVDGRKRRIVARVAAAWRMRHGRAGYVYRFDVIVIRPSDIGEECLVEHVEDAWRVV